MLVSNLDEILSFNEEFVSSQSYEPYRTDKFPSKKMVIVTCMDTRLTELLPRAMNFKNGDAKVIKTAGALICEPYGSVMRSLLVAVTLLKAEEVFVVGHLDCGMIGLQAAPVLAELEKKGISKERMENLRHSGVDIENWLHGCQDVESGVMESVNLIRNHPLFPSHLMVHGLTINPVTGKLHLVFDGREAKNL
ncbi:beta-class carbonic anhydrase [Paenactinomyces guangxiensis]|uniref:carbonic anhydrase n=1 Tax=Paenactinomyces guangxiensis TaxID=1490290 RepID=A0A7W1WNS2_9BACL|nr:carbonic anhydrase [Paenactinomyces guangxiensis]MBA4493215.1 carbonic anhydrase [Paenactinomyces guangxiensis]MBH8589935.1 carbonic anhydrase [Paenactinomyces guangxiensis]